MHAAVILNATQRAVVTLKCSPDVGRSDPAWTREVKGKTKSVFGQGQDGQTEVHSRFVVSPVNQTLTITRVQPEDSGLYFCEEKPAAYVIVMDAASAQQFLWLLGVFLPLLLILTVIFLTWRHTIKRRGGEQRDTVYAEIADRPMFELQQVHIPVQASRANERPLVHQNNYITCCDSDVKKKKKEKKRSENALLLVAVVGFGLMMLLLAAVCLLLISMKCRRKKNYRYAKYAVFEGPSLLEETIRYASLGRQNWRERPSKTPPNRDHQDIIYSSVITRPAA
ncbi:hypothetical protein Q8A73_000109 [Channa argus]|nr:hypothetical protein Q8A73_000109 [Channa argus]